MSLHNINVSNYRCPATILICLKLSMSRHNIDLSQITHLPTLICLQLSSPGISRPPFISFPLWVPQKELSSKTITNNLKIPIFPYGHDKIWVDY